MPEKNHTKLPRMSLGKTDTTKEKSTNDKKVKVILSKSQITKSVILGVITVLTGILAWYLVYRILNNGLTLEPGEILASVIRIILPVLSFCLWLALIGIMAVFVKVKKIFLPVYLVSSLTHFIFFGFSYETLAVFALLFFAFVYFARGVKKEAKDRVTFHIVKIIKIHLGITLMLCVLGVSLIFYSRMVETQETEDKTMGDILSESTGELVNLVLASQIKAYDPDMTLDEFILVAGQEFIEGMGSQLGEEVQIEGSFEQENIISEMKAAIDRGEIKREELPKDVLEKLDQGELTAEDIVENQLTDIFTKQLAQARDDFLGQLGIEAEGSDKISEVIKEIVSSKLGESLSKYEHLIPPFLALSLFFSLVVFLFLYKTITKIFALLIYSVLRLGHFIYISTEEKEVEIAELK